MTFDKEWENIFKSRSWGKYPSEEVIRFMARNYYGVPDRSRVKVLDLGCGTGANSWFVGREGFSVFGIDGSESAISAASERFKKERMKGDFIVGDINYLPYENESFDCVLDVCAMQHNVVSDIRQIVNEVKRVLKKGGKVFGMCASIKTSGKGKAKVIEINTFRGMDDAMISKGLIIHLFSEKEIVKLFDGFERMSIDKIRRTDHDGRHAVENYIYSFRRP